MRLSSVVARLLWVSLLLAFCPTAAQVNVTTYHNDNARTGQNIQETTLTPANVNSGQFGKLFSVTVDGYVYAQPLYLSGITINGGTHNVLYVATEHDSLYAIDADSGTIYWQVSLIPAGGTTVSSTGFCDDLVPEIGITGTPVIDLSTKTIYLVAKTNEGGNIVQRLHAIDAVTHAEKFGGPKVISASVPGTGDGSSGSPPTVAFNSLLENQRPALLLENSHIIIGWGSHCDISPYHGWLMSYSASTLAQEAVFNANPNGEDSGIWMSGGGVAADASGNLFFSTGNGTYDGAAKNDYGDTILKLSPPSGGSFAVADWFTPWDQASFDTSDNDVSSGAPVLLPALPNGNQYLVLIGKVGTMYLVNRNNMGKFCSSCTSIDTQIVQEVPNATVGVWGSPAYWNNTVYWGGGSNYAGPDNLKAFSFNANGSGLMSTSPTSKSTQLFSYAAPVPSISANGNSNGILWGLDNSSYLSACCQILYAFNATNLGSMIYNSNQAANNRDVPGGAVKFSTPTIANGKVYLGSQSKISAYGLLSGNPTTAATPTFSPLPGTFSSAQSVTLSDTTTGATIYYTTNGTTPTTGSTVYKSAIAVNTTTTIKAMAAATGSNNSTVASGTYTIASGGTGINYGSGFSSTGLILNGSAAINGTRLRLTDGGANEAASAYYSTAQNVQTFTTDFSFQQSNPSADGMTFIIQNAGTTAISLSGGGLGYGSSSPSNGVVGIGKSVAVKFDLFNSAGEGGNSTGLYTNGASPTIPAVTLGGGVNLHSGDVFNVHMTYDGTTLSMTITDASVPADMFTTSWTVNIPGTVGSNTALIGFTAGTGSLTATQDIITWSFNPGTVTNPTAATPTFSPLPGTFSSAQSVTLSDTTTGATIYYTTNGTTPTTGSTVYKSAIAVNTTTTIKAMAAATGSNNSTVASGTYTIASGGTGINYGSGFSSTGLILNGSAAINGTRLRLTDGGANEAASAYYSTAQNVQTFTTDFSFQQSNPSADGMTFIIQNAGTTAISLSGGGLGYGSSSPSNGVVGIGKSVAVKFDLFNSAGEGGNSTGLYTNGASPTIPAVTLGGGVNLHSGDVFNVHMTYDGTTLSMTITDASVPADMFTTSWTVNIPGTVGSNTALIGFTAGTGSLTATQDIITWSFNPGTVTNPTAATPTFSPLPGTFSSAQSVTLSDTTTGATIYYTTNGTTPTTGSTVYKSAIAVNTTTTIKAMAAATGSNNSTVASGTYTIASGGTGINYGSGFSSTGLILNGSAAINGTRLRLTDGGANEAASAYYSTAQNVQTFTTDFSFQQSNPSADGMTFIIQNAGTTAISLSGGGLGYGSSSPSNGVVGIGKSVAVKFDLFNSAGEGGNSTGLYTNGASPTIPAVTLGGGVNLHSGDVFNVHMTYDGTTLSMTITDASVPADMFTTSWTVNIPGTVGSNTALIGFTAGTGSLTATQDIITWSYTH